LDFRIGYQTKKKGKNYKSLRMEKELADITEYIENAGLQSQEGINRFLLKLEGKKLITANPGVMAGNQLN